MSEQQDQEQDATPEVPPAADHTPLEKSAEAIDEAKDAAAAVARDRSSGLADVTEDEDESTQD